MSEPDFSNALDARLRVARILTVAIIAGAVIAGAILITLRTQNPPQPPAQQPIVSYVGYAFAAICLLASVLVPGIILASFRKQIAQGRQPNSSAPWPQPPNDLVSWITLYQSSLIISLALLEGPTFLQLIAYFLEGQSISLGVALGLVACMILKFPTRAGVERWIETQRELVEREKQSAME
jgi:hypothetical protein